MKSFIPVYFWVIELLFRFLMWSYHVGDGLSANCFISCVGIGSRNCSLCYMHEVNHVKQVAKFHCLGHEFLPIKNLVFSLLPLEFASFTLLVKSSLRWERLLKLILSEEGHWPYELVHQVEVVLGLQRDPVLLLRWAAHHKIVQGGSWCSSCTSWLWGGHHRFQMGCFEHRWCNLALHIACSRHEIGVTHIEQISLIIWRNINLSWSWLFARRMIFW